MNTDLVFQIVNLAVALAQGQTTGGAQQSVRLAGILLQIIQKAVQAYQQHTGETLDPALIKAENTVSIST